ncbi:hypothetical protein [Hymenobacter terricola]|uniref:hypothetical protein n=1 Tax=Hymenobacter terricola TaxID=2819236 RepID=UPI001CF568F5|nr:hypothetical protein [Hymenobacter terricola]
MDRYSSGSVISATPDAPSHLAFSWVMCFRRFLLLYLVALGLPLSALGAGDIITFSGWLVLLVLLVGLAGFFALPSGVIILLYWLRDKLSKR